MKRRQYGTVLALAWVCLALGVSILVLSGRNASLQRRLQAQQIQLNNGLMGQRGQQITAQILQEMIDATGRSPQIRQLLTKYGYSTPASSTNHVAK
jgi:hypothetical protein